MKILFTALMLCSFCLNAHGQLNQGTWLAGGTGKFYAYNSTYTSATYSNEASYTQIDLSANIGFFVADKLAFGIKPSFSSIKGEVTTPGGLYTNVQRYSIGPFSRYYFMEKERAFNILADLSWQYGIINFGRKQIGHFNSLSILAGPVVYFNSSIGLEFLMGYSSSLQDNDQAYKQTQSGFQIGVGFQIHLEK